LRARRCHRCPYSLRAIPAVRNDSWGCDIAQRTHYEGSVLGEPKNQRMVSRFPLGFSAERPLVILTLPDGDFVEVIGDAGEDPSRVLPVGGTLRQIELTEPWVVPLPTLTRTFSWMDKSLRSIQGPVTVPRDAK
jgi:hypothetical protein